MAISSAVAKQFETAEGAHELLSKKSTTSKVSVKDGIQYTVVIDKKKHTIGDKDLLTLLKGIKVTDSNAKVMKEVLGDVRTLHENINKEIGTIAKLIIKLQNFFTPSKRKGMEKERSADLTKVLYKVMSSLEKLKLEVAEKEAGSIRGRFGKMYTELKGEALRSALASKKHPLEALKFEKEDVMRLVMPEGAAGRVAHADKFGGFKAPKTVAKKFKVPGLSKERIGDVNKLKADLGLPKNFGPNPSEKRYSKEMPIFRKNLAKLAQHITVLGYQRAVKLGKSNDRALLTVEFEMRTNPNFDPKKIEFGEKGTGAGVAILSLNA